PRSIERRSLQADIDHRALLWRGDFRVAVAPSKLESFIASAKPRDWSADATFGIVVGHASEESWIRDAIRSVGGSLTVSLGGRAEGPRFDFEVTSAPQRQLLERLKKSFDPENRLAPLPWQQQQTA